MDCHINPRRLWDDENPVGYMESDKDFVLNNIDAAVQLLERELKIREQKPLELFVCGQSPSDRTHGTQIETMPSKSDFDRACARFADRGI
jgi:hypothetical protein